MKTRTQNWMFGDYDTREKVICHANPDGTTSVIMPAPEMFDTVSMTRWDLRRQGVDFSDGAAMIAWVNARISASQLAIDQYNAALRVAIQESVVNKTEVIFDMPEPAPLMTIEDAVQAYVDSDEYIPNIITAADEVRAYVVQKDVPEGIPSKIKLSSELPADRTFRNAWEFDFDAAEISVNLDKAKVLQQERIRVMRDDKFNQADADFNKAVEKVVTKLSVALPGDPDVAELNAAIEKRQALRDAPAIDLSGIDNVDDLKDTLPDVVKGK
jgi:hypothetical protein